MDLSEVLESSNITHDDKARRVLNTAPNVKSNISVDTLSSGVTIEQLEALNVPVYQYGGQITIHGIFDGLDSPQMALRVNGYKSLLPNQNGSLGVKYVAIDSDKKHLLSKVSRLGNRSWGIIIDSQGCQAQKVFRDKQTTIDCYKSTPDDLYIGNKQAAALMYGGYAVIIHIGAIYEQNLWPLIGVLTGITSQAEYDKLTEAKKIEDDKREAEYQADLAATRAKAAEAMAKAKADFKAPNEWIPFDGLVDKSGIYAKIGTAIDKPALFVTMVTKRGGKLCKFTKKFDDFVYTPFRPTKYHAFTPSNFSGWKIE
jgi:hypothetical protein